MQSIICGAFAPKQALAKVNSADVRHDRDLEKMFNILTRSYVRHDRDPEKRSNILTRSYVRHDRDLEKINKGPIF